MDRKGMSIALNTVGIAILVVVVVLVLGFIFFGYASKLFGIEDRCGEGVYEQYQCYPERPDGEGFAHCFVNPPDRCAQGEAALPDADTQTVCCRTG